MLGEITDEQWRALSVLTNKHKIPGYIRNGQTHDKQYNVESILLESQKYLSYVKDRANVIMNELKDLKYIDPESGLDYTNSIGKMQYIQFKPNTTAPIEDVAISIAQGWSNNEEPGKLNPIKYEDEIYRVVHQQALSDLQENNGKNLRIAIKNDGFETINEKIEGAKEGIRYINKMWKSYYEMINNFGNTIGPVSWDKNEELAAFADKWNAEYSELSDTGKVAGTIQFLRLMHVVKENEIKNTRNRKVLPPFSKNQKATLLHPGIMKEYLNYYNNRILDVEGRTQARGAFSNNQSFESIIRDEC